jgi:hypothetical protein
MAPADPEGETVRTAGSTLVRSRRWGNVRQAEGGVLHPGQHDRTQGENKQPYQDPRPDPHTKAAVIWIVDRTVGIIERNHEN